MFDFYILYFYQIYSYIFMLLYLSFFKQRILGSVAQMTMGFQRQQIPSNSVFLANLLDKFDPW